MLRKSLRYSSRAVLSATISWSLIPIAAADAPSNPPQKRLFTVPEDGMGDDAWLSGENNIVRAILAKRPKEDVVICVAGCVAYDRVVYAQPAIAPKPKPKTDLMSAAPASQPVAATDTAPADAAADPAQAKPAAQAAAGNDNARGGAESGAALKTSEGAGNGHSRPKSAFVPTSSAPAHPSTETPSEPSLGGEMN